ncbi:helix-turn-helix domain-containing protein [Bacillus sp. FJAT-42315]|uniref:helix-turn-helix domain-containing protein n=1 Tax=Bacillus sp. FJAT-42315 TaxID=2014077 RepID=UPI000C248CFD|nr:helix-turn-helix transcriptional regulator [Bacillus sp. FJAT-42315]
MKVGKTISEIRKTNKMTQEEFASLFHVTRQTVSNWENEKSYPDLQTLVDISNRFDVSLDRMLKGDTVMVKTIDREIKIGKQFKKGIIVLGSILIVVGMIWSILWNINKNTVEGKFQSGVEELGFIYNEQLGYYTKEMGDGTTFKLPNQKMPDLLDFSLDFHAKHLDYYTEIRDEPLWLRWSGKDKDGQNPVSIHLLEGSLSKKEEEDLKNGTELSNIIDEAEKIYETVYK